MKRTGFRRPVYQPPPNAPARPLAGPVSYARITGDVVAVPKEPKPLRDEPYRRLVAELPCYECRIVGYSNAAHPNSGKTKGVKRDDGECFPLCVDRPGVSGCHSRFDRYEIVDRAGMPAYEAAALAWTRAQLRGGPTGGI